LKLARRKIAGNLRDFAKPGVIPKFGTTPGK
jgi:hypothetical protein